MKQLAVRTRTSDRPRACLAQLARQGPCWAVLLFGGAVAAIVAGTTVAVVAMALVIAFVAVAAHAPGFRRLVARADERRRLDGRRRDREDRLLAANVPRGPLRGLTDLAAEIRRLNPCDAEQLDVEGLLDHYVDLELEHERLERTLAATELGMLAHSLREIPERDASPRRAVLERRLALWTTGRTRADELAEQIGTTIELVRLIAQRAALAACAPAPEAACVDAALAELDSDDAARSELDLTLAPPAAS